MSSVVARVRIRSRKRPASCSNPVAREPTVPRDLADREGIQMSNVAGATRLSCTGLAAIAMRAVPFGGRFRVDHGLAAREAFVAGRGNGPAHRWLVDDLLSAGQLAAMLPDYALPPFRSAC